MERKKQVWFTSDSHYNHSNLCKGVSRWSNVDGARDFTTVEEMNNALVDRYNEVVDQNDEVYHLGDWSWGGTDKIKEFHSRLICKNIHLILGNHDKEIERNSEGVKGLFKSVTTSKQIYVEGQMIVLSHYAHTVWNKSHRDAWMLFGHSHGTLKRTFPAETALEMLDNGKINELRSMLKDEKMTGSTFDVGVDSHDFYPWSFEEVKREMAKRKPLPWDRHEGRRHKEE